MQSMTGYGRGLVCEDGREMTVEVKSVNHRFLDVSFRLARPIAFLDDAVRTGVAERLARGHVDVFVNYVNHREDARRVHVDMQLAKAYRQAAGELSEALGVKNDLPLSDYMNMPDVLTVEASEEDQDAVRALFMRALNLALDDLTAMRKREGNSLRGDMMKKLDAIDGLRESIATRAPMVVEEYRAKLSQRLSALLSGDIDLLVGVEVVHVAHGDVVSEGLGPGRQGPVGARGGHVGVEDENEGLHECSCCQTMMVGCAARIRAPGAP